MKTNAALQTKAPPLHLVSDAPPPVTLPVRAVEPRTGDPAMRRVIEQAGRMARSDLPVMLLGESGTGKEVLAQYVHAASGRAAGPLVAENCSAIPESLAESVLFGHARGAFTGADRDRDGLFVQADGGTLFLDEVGEMPLALQARLLRVLEEHRVRPVGAQKSVPVDVRIVCATNRDLPALVRAGRFREDLYYRLAVTTLSIPALRDRPGDVDVLAAHFLDELNALHGTERRFSGGLLASLRAHAWPGNVRELRNRVHALFHLSGPGEICGTVGGGAAATSQPIEGGRLLTRLAPLAELEREAIELALVETRGDRREAARRLGISRSTLYVRIRELEL